jgi:hypothetical protein
MLTERRKPMETGSGKKGKQNNQGRKTKRIVRPEQPSQSRPPRIEARYKKRHSRAVALAGLAAKGRVFFSTLSLVPESFAEPARPGPVCSFGAHF